MGKRQSGRFSWIAEDLDINILFEVYFPDQVCVTKVRKKLLSQLSTNTVEALLSKAYHPQLLQQCSFEVDSMKVC